MQTRSAPGVDVPPPLRPTVRRRVRTAFVAVLILGLVLVAVVVGINLQLFNRLDRIDGAFEGLADRPAAAPGETLLMFGTRPGGSHDVGWLEGTQSIESVMLVEIDKAGTSVDVASLPLLDGIVASAASGRPSRAVAAAEGWAQRRVDHMIVVDWRSFVQLAADNGIEASYRYGSGPAIQHDYLRAVLEGTLHAELRKQPVNLYRALSTMASGATVDDEWSLLEFDRLLIHMRDLRSANIAFSMAQPG